MPPSTRHTGPYNIRSTILVISYHKVHHISSGRRPMGHGLEGPAARMQLRLKTEL